MLTEIKLKEKLIAKINDTHDVELLHQLSRVIELEEQAYDVYILSPEEREAVMEGISQIESGRFVTNEDRIEELKNV